MEALSNAESRARGDFNNQVQSTTDLFNAQIPTINSARDKAFNVIGDAQRMAEQGSNTALNSARELGGQLTQRATNLFGSGALSGVGQAAQEIYGRETQRNTNNIRQNLVNNIQTLNNQRKEVEVEAQNKIQNVQAQLQQAITNLQSQLSARLQDIDNLRGEVASRRDELKLDLMREYRTEARALQNEARSFAQQIAIETGNASRYLDTLMGQYNEALRGAEGSAMNTSSNVIMDSLSNSQNFSDGINTGSYGDMSLAGISGYSRPREEDLAL
jgi:Sec-independent protein translocase protein TatA